MITNFFSFLSFVTVFGSGMGKNQDPGSGINIPDPPHWVKYDPNGVHCTDLWNLGLMSSSLSGTISS
jgi:hypothetical protein